VFSGFADATAKFFIDEGISVADLPGIYPYLHEYLKQIVNEQYFYDEQIQVINVFKTSQIVSIFMKTTPTQFNVIKSLNSKCTQLLATVIDTYVTKFWKLVTILTNSSSSIQSLSNNVLQVNLTNVENTIKILPKLLKFETRQAYSENSNISASVFLRNFYESEIQFYTQLDENLRINFAEIVSSTKKLTDKQLKNLYLHSNFPDSSIHDSESFIDFQHCFKEFSNKLLSIFFEFYEVNEIYTPDEGYSGIAKYYGKSKLVEKIYDEFVENSWDSLVYNYVNFLSSKLQNWNFDVYRPIYESNLSDKIVTLPFMLLQPIVHFNEISLSIADFTSKNSKCKSKFFKSLSKLKSGIISPISHYLNENWQKIVSNITGEQLSPFKNKSGIKSWKFENLCATQAATVPRLDSYFRVKGFDQKFIQKVSEDLHDQNLNAIPTFCLAEINAKLLLKNEIWDVDVFILNGVVLIVRLPTKNQKLDPKFNRFIKPAGFLYSPSGKFGLINNRVMINTGVPLSKNLYLEFKTWSKTLFFISQLIHLKSKAVQNIIPGDIFVKNHLNSEGPSSDPDFTKFENIVGNKCKNNMTYINKFDFSKIVKNLINVKLPDEQRIHLIRLLCFTWRSLKKSLVEWVKRPEQNAIVSELIMTIQHFTTPTYEISEINNAYSLLLTWLGANSVYVSDVDRRRILNSIPEYSTNEVVAKKQYLLKKLLTDPPMEKLSFSLPNSPTTLENISILHINVSALAFAITEFQHAQWKQIEVQRLNLICDNHACRASKTTCCDKYTFKKKGEFESYSLALQNWISDEIFQFENFEERTLALEKYFQLHFEFLKLKNFQACFDTITVLLSFTFERPGSNGKSLQDLFKTNRAVWQKLSKSKNTEAIEAIRSYQQTYQQKRWVGVLWYFHHMYKKTVMQAEQRRLLNSLKITDPFIPSYTAVILELLQAQQSLVYLQPEIFDFNIAYKYYLISSPVIACQNRDFPPFDQEKHPILTNARIYTRKIFATAFSSTPAPDYAKLIDKYNESELESKKEATKFARRFPKLDLDTENIAIEEFFDSSSLKGPKLPPRRKVSQQKSESSNKPITKSEPPPIPRRSSTVADITRLTNSLVLPPKPDKFKTRQLPPRRPTPPILDLPVFDSKITVPPLPPRNKSIISPKFTIEAIDVEEDLYRPLHIKKANDESEYRSFDQLYK